MTITWTSLQQYNFDLATLVAVSLQSPVILHTGNFYTSRNIIAPTVHSLLGTVSGFEFGVPGTSKITISY